jgi:hypothetical protein
MIDVTPWIAELRAELARVERAIAALEELRARDWLGLVEREKPAP